MLYIVVVVVHDTQNHCIFQKAMTQKSAKGQLGRKSVSEYVRSPSIWAAWHIGIYILSQGCFSMSRWGVALVFHGFSYG